MIASSIFLSSQFVPCRRERPACLEISLALCCCHVLPCVAQNQQVFETGVQILFFIYTMFMIIVTNPQIQYVASFHDP